MKKGSSQLNISLQLYRRDKRRQTKFEEKNKKKGFYDSIWGRETEISTMWRCLKKIEAAENILIIPIDELKTPRIYNKCGTGSLKDHNVLVCRNCNAVWQRNINTSKNMFPISLRFGRTTVYLPLIAEANTLRRRIRYCFSFEI
ncbi:hypothetical protein BDF21DRAFT_447525 [Thamnidium elegans]|nr:hypothetical protein BDF21DRAFT_447525 [Thamnidium elegans]